MQRKIAYAGGIVAIHARKKVKVSEIISETDHSEVQIQVKNAKRHRSAVGGIVRLCR